MKDAKGHGSNPRGSVGDAAHASGVNQIGQPQSPTKWRMNTYTHEIVSPAGDVVGRMRLGKSNGGAFDFSGRPDLPQGVHYFSGPAMHDDVAMAGYRSAKSGGGGDFPAEHIGGALHFVSGDDFAGHTVRRTPAGGKKYGSINADG